MFYPAMVPVAVSVCEALLWEAVTPCICLSVSPTLGASTLPCVLPSLTDQRRVDFSVFSGFCLLLEPSGNSQAPYM